MSVSSSPSFHTALVASTLNPGAFMTIYRQVRCDANGYLQIVIPPGVPLGVDVQQYGSVAVTSAGLAGTFAVGGTSAPGAAFTSNPLGISALANTDAAMPVDVAANTGVRIAADLKGRIHINVGTIRGTAAVQGGVNGLLGVGGSEGDDVAGAANPVVIGGIYLNPQTALAGSGNVGRVLIDDYRRQRVVGAVPHRDPWAATDPSPVAVGGYADVSFSAGAAPDGSVCRFVSNAKGWQRIEAFGPTLDGAACDANANYPVPTSGLYRATPTAELADGDQGTVAVDERRMHRIAGGDNADDGVAYGTWPVVIGGHAAADPTLSTISAAGDIAYALFDLNRYLFTHDKAYDATSLANRVFEVSPLNLQVVEESLVDTTNHAASAGIRYPSDDGIVAMGYKDFSLTGKFICGADNTVTLTVQGTNDEDATPANRDWITVYGWRSDTNGVVNSIANPASTTTTFGWDFDEWNYRYFRINLVIVNGGVLSNTVIVKERRKAL